MATLSVVVNAFDADDKQYTATFKLDQHKPLSETLSEWATLFNIPVSVVGFEDESHNAVDSSQSPSTLGWKGQVELQAVPLNDEWADENPPTTAVGAGAKGAGTSVAAGATTAGAGAGAAKGTGALIVELPPPASASPSAPVAAAASPGAASPAAASPAAAAAAKGGAGKKRPAPAQPAPPAAGAKCPQDDDAVVFLDENPKRAGTGAHARYEKYKSAKTPREALSLGAVAGDIANDFKKGYLSRA